MKELERLFPLEIGPAAPDGVGAVLTKSAVVRVPRSVVSVGGEVVCVCVCLCVRERERAREGRRLGYALSCGECCMTASSCLCL